MDNKKKKIIAIVVPIVLFLLIALIIVLVVVLPKKDNDNPPAHTEHIYKYENKDATNHTVTCEECDYEESKAHTFKYAKSDATNHTVTCEYCDYEESKDHTFKYEESDATNHTVTCEECDYEEAKPHTWANAQATTCSDCGHFRTIVGEVNTPSLVTISASKNHLVAGDTFTLSVQIKADMPADCLWHSVALVITALDEQNKVNQEVASYFECVSITHNIDTDYFDVPSAGKFTDANPLYCGMGISIANDTLDRENTKADTVFEFTIELKVKEDAPDVSTFNFGVMPTQANFLRFRQGRTNVTYIVGDENITINSIPLSIKAK